MTNPKHAEVTDEHRKTAAEAVEPCLISGPDDKRHCAAHHCYIADGDRSGPGFCWGASFLREGYAQAIADGEARTVAKVGKMLMRMEGVEDRLASPGDVQQHKGAFHEGGAASLKVARDRLRNGDWRNYGES